MTTPNQDEVVDHIVKYLRERLRTLGGMRQTLDIEERAITTLLRLLEGGK